MGKFRNKKKKNQQPKNSFDIPMTKVFDSNAARAKIKGLEDVDLANTSIDDLKGMVSSLLDHALFCAPVLDVGTRIYSMFVGRKPLNLEELTASSAGPLGLEANSVLYCGLGKPLAFFEHLPPPTTGQEVTFVEWEVKKELPLNRVGFSSKVFEKLGIKRKTQPQREQPYGKESEFVLDYLAEKFLDSMLERGENKFKSAISQVFLVEPVGGIVFPAMRLKGSSDFFAIKREIVSTHLRFRRAEFIRIEDIAGESATTKGLNLCWEANSKGNLEWYIDPSGAPRYGTFGWEEFVRQKKDILSVYDAAKENSKNRPVQTEHGQVGEGKFREWLSEFLPKKYAVTSGYIIPDQRVMSYTLRHYDTIIYDQLNSPVLWASNNPDHSAQGRHRAIPAKYVQAAFEVKATFNSKHVSAVLEKLRGLTDCQPDLPKTFVSGAIFLEVLKDEQENCKLVERLFANIPGYFGGLIFRAEGMDPLLSGYYTLMPSNTETVPNMVLVRDPGTFQRDLDGNPQLRDQGDTAMAVSFDNIWNFDKGYSPVVRNVSLVWSYNSFTSFVFDLLARMDGTYKPGEVGNLGSYGRSFNR